MGDAFTTSASSIATSNTLDSYQRARLIRSTRKLEAILGTTPQLAETEPISITFPMKPPPSPRTKASRRHGSIFSIFPIVPPSASNASLYSSSSTNTSLSSLALPEPRSNVEALPTPKSFSSKPRRSAEAPRPLVLRVHTVPVEPLDSRLPMSPFAVASAQEPLTPTCADLPRLPSAAEVRRKRMAKLARTFGENVPQEYVFPTAAESASHSRTRSRWTQATRPQPESLPAKPSSQIWVTGSNAWTGEWNRKDIKEVQSKLRSLRVK